MASGRFSVLPFPGLFLAAAVLAATATGGAIAQEEPLTYHCESGNIVVVHLEVADEAVKSARLEYDGASFDMFVVASGPGLRLSTEQGLAPDRGLQWQSENGTGRLSEMIMDHTAGGPVVIETCTLAENEPAAPAGLPRISGEVFYLERIMIPGQPMLTLTLVDLADGTGLAGTSFEITGANIPFDLFIDAPASLQQRPLGLAAEISVEGEVWFATDAPLAIDLQSTEPVSIRVLRSAGEQNPATEAAAPLPTGSWRATVIDGAPVEPEIEVSLTIGADGAVSGTGGCNRFGGNAVADAAGLAFTDMFSTMMACLDPGAEQERRFLDALGETVSFTMEGENLVLLGTGGQERVRFAPM